ncbi:tyrosine-type recombinase/integrase [Streptomyces sp. 4503]|uniref:Tyrosine-type recombinase/integrase n=1 Tax=Streptomyces niphimycinicus TaxID=2842201 RepID=A0ABS6CT68_9ACTN|nr:tyrosine-type recombinase/integrase [Streptomyces niphimycinicus]
MGPSCVVVLGVLVEDRAQVRRRAAELGLPRIGVHDLRHTAATIMISSRVPLAVVSKTLRHSTLATTANLYGHLLPHAARDAVAAIGTALERADRKHATGDPGGASEQRAA